MEKKYFLLCLFCYVGFAMAIPHAWINEIHYDNAGTDIDEFVEVVVESPEGWYLGDLALYMYNGYDGKAYCLDTIDEFEIGERIGPFQFYVWYQRGIQNDMEGMILVFKDTLCDIIAYEGSFIGNNDPAFGVEFPDIGICETAYGSDSCSIYLSGMPGSQWLYGSATPRQLNIGQEISESGTPVHLSKFYARSHEDGVLLRWQSESESECMGYRLYRNGYHLATVEAHGTSSISNSYSFMDKGTPANIPHEYIISSIDYSGSETFLDTLILSETEPSVQSKPFTLGLPCPNPFNSACAVNIHVYEPVAAKMKLFDLSGKNIMTILDRFLPEGDYSFMIDPEHHPSGKYFLHCSGGGYLEVMEILMLK